MSMTHYRSVVLFTLFSQSVMVELRHATSADDTFYQPTNERPMWVKHQPLIKGWPKKLERQLAYHIDPDCEFIGFAHVCHGAAVPCMGFTPKDLVGAIREMYARMPKGE